MCRALGDSEPFTIIVIGGGISGVAFTERLSDLYEQYRTRKEALEGNNVKALKIILLEEGDKLGGRIRQFEFAGRLFEEGANHIHGTRNKHERLDNPVWKLAK